MLERCYKCVKTEYINLCDNKIPLYLDFSNGDIKLCPQFTKLWNLFCSVNTTTNLIPTAQNEIVTDFSLPTTSVSNLSGTPDITDPNSEVIVYTLVNNNPNGPVTTSEPNFVMDLFSQALFYQISWDVIEPTSKNFRIGFYTSDNFMFNTLNRLFLICSCEGPALFNKRSGSFINPGTLNFYVATNEFVKINVTVTVIIPKKRIYPIVTPCDEYVKYINICNDNSKYKIPVYTIKYIPDDQNMPKGLVTPTPQFKKVARKIQKFLDSTSLSITLFPIINGPLLGSELFPVNTTVSHTFSSVSNCAKNKTADIPGDPYTHTYSYDGCYYGIQLFPQKNMVPVISYQFLINADFPSLRRCQNMAGFRCLFAFVFLEYFVDGRWETLTQINGDLAIQDISSFNSGFNVINNSFTLQEDTDAVNITIKYGTEGDILVANDAADHTSDLRIGVKYIPTPAP